MALTTVQPPSGNSDLRRGASRLALACAVLVAYRSARGAADPGVSVSPGPQDGIAYRAGERSLFRVTAINRGAQPRRVLASTQITGGSGMAFSREFHLPGRSQRVTWHPVYVPQNLPADQPQVEAETRQSDFPLGAPRATAVPAPGGAARKTSLSLERERSVTALLSDPDDRSIRQLVAAARRTQNLSGRLTQLRADELPFQAEWLEAVDQLVLASDELTDNPAALIAVRQWLEAGGRIWIMMDRTSVGAVSALLGDDYAMTIVDRLRLADFAIKDVRQVPRKFDGPSLELTTPTDFVRIIVDRPMHTAFEARGWPAACWQKVGRGGVLFTTVGIDAWVPPADRTASESKAAPGSNGGPLQALASELLRPRAVAAPLPRLAQRHAAELVGYSIPSRRAVAAILGGCAVASVVLTGLSFRWRRRAHLAWMAVAVAVGGSGAMIALGASTRRAVEPTLVSLQLVHVVPSRGEMHVHSLVGGYHPTATDEGIEGTDCALASTAPLLKSPRGRIVWSDSDRWRVEDALLPAGLSLQPCSWRAPLKRGAVLAATLTPRGIVGVLDVEQFGQAENAVLAAPTMSRLAVEIDANGGFRAGSAGRLEVDQFVASQLVGDEANRRQRLYRALFPVDGREPSLELDGPTLLFWARPLDSPLNFGSAERRAGDALIAAPISITPPAVGASVAIPSVLLPFRAVDGNDGTPVASAYSNERQAWVDSLVAASQITLRFQLPPATLPLTVKQATLHVQLSAPSRTVTLSGWHGKELAPVQTVQSPVGVRLKAPIRDPAALRLDDGGGLLLNITVGPHPREREANLAKIGWSIQRAWLDVDEAIVEPR